MNFKLLTMARKYRNEAGEGEGSSAPVETTPETVSKPAASADASKPTDGEAKLLKEVMKRKERERALEAELDGIKKKFDGINPDEVRALLDEKRQAEEKRLEANQQWEQLKERMASEHVKQMTAKEEQLSAVLEKLSAKEKLLNEKTIGSAFSESTFVKDSLLLTPQKARVVYGSHFDIDQDGNVVAFDKPAGVSNRTLLVDASGNAMSFEAAIAWLVDKDPEKDYLLRNKAKPGSGGGTTTVPTTVAEKIAEANKPEASGVARIAAGLAKRK